MTHRHGPFTARVDEVSEDAWNALTAEFADANIYQTWAYGATCWGEGQLSHLVLERDGAAVALAQLRVVRVPVLGAGIAYLRWGPVCVRRDGPWDPAAWRAMTAALREEYVTRRRLVLRMIPAAFVQDAGAADVGRGLAELGFVEDPTIRPYHTLRVDLRHPLETLRQRLSSRWRRQLNIAERNGLEVDEGVDDARYLEFLALYRQMKARKQFDTLVDVDDFRDIQRRLPATQKMLTLICRAAGRPVAGLVVATVGHTAVYLLAATGDEGLQARGSYLLQWQAMQRLQALGVGWYDLGGVNAEANPGVFTFKSGMGGEAVVQLGRYETGDSGLSRLCVSAGEGARALVRRVGRRG